MVDSRRWKTVPRWALPVSCWDLWICSQEHLFQLSKASSPQRFLLSCPVRLPAPRLCPLPPAPARPSSSPFPEACPRLGRRSEDLTGGGPLPSDFSPCSMLSSKLRPAWSLLGYSGQMLHLSRLQFANPSSGAKHGILLCRVNVKIK